MLRLELPGRGIRSFYLLLHQNRSNTLEKALLQKCVTGAEPVPVIFQYHGSSGKGVTVLNLTHSRGLPPSCAFCVLPLSSLSLSSPATVLSFVLLGQQRYLRWVLPLLAAKSTCLKTLEILVTGITSGATEPLCGDISGSVWQGMMNTQKVEIFLKEKHGASPPDPAEQRFFNSKGALELAGLAGTAIRPVPELPMLHAHLAGFATQNYMSLCFLISYRLLTRLAQPILLPCRWKAQSNSFGFGALFLNGCYLVMLI